MRYTVFFVFGLVLLFAQQNLFRVLDFVTIVLENWHVPRAYAQLPGFTPSLVLPLLLFLGVQEVSLPRGSAIAFVLGYLSDLVGATPVGLYTFAFVCIFVLARFAGLRFAAQTRWMQFLLCFGFTLTKCAIILICLAIFGRERDTWVPRKVFPFAFPHAIFTALVGPIIFRMAEQVYSVTATRTETAKDA